MKSPSTNLRGLAMLEVTCDWGFHDEHDVNTLIKQNARLAKLYLLWRKNHITDQHFLPKILEPWEEGCEDYNKLETQEAAFYVLRYALGNRPMGLSKDIQVFISEKWPYFSPSLNWKIKVNFTEGQIPSITI